MNLSTTPLPPLHDRIMNLPCDADQIGSNINHRLSFKLGHKAARHAAAELANAADAELQRLREDIRAGFRIANELTLETQTVEEMAADLVRQVRDARAAQQPAEPAAWIAKDRGVYRVELCLPCDGDDAGLDWQPLYAAPVSPGVDSAAYQQDGQVPTGQPDPAVAHALGEAVAALYFADNSDYEAALTRIVLDLGGQEAADLLRTDGSAAYHRYGADRDATGTAGTTGESNA